MAKFIVQTYVSAKQAQKACLSPLFNGANPHSEALGRNSLHSQEELTEATLIGKVKSVSNLGDAHRCGAQQERGLHQQHLADIVDDGATRYLTDDTREIDRRDVEPRGIEGNVAVLGKVLGQETDEANENFLYALGRLPASDGLLLGVLHVEQEDGVKHTQHLTFIDVVGVQVDDDFTHPLGQMPRSRVRQCQFRLVQLHDRLVGDVHQVAHGGHLDGGMLVGHQAEAMIILRSRDDVDREAGRIEIEVISLECQHPAIT